MSIFLSLGTNIGDLKKNLATARRLLEEAGVHIVRASSEIETKAWGIEEQADFFNQVLRVEYFGDVYALLDLCQEVEMNMGKIQISDEKYVKWGPRIIDIDILKFNDLEIEDAHLTIPHHSVKMKYVQDLLSEVSAE